ncbi:hypothetical protein E4U60_007959 [Claviceps pazoutovae]|uniref:Uncharacterized protein n=1 Tax=Claviceps pazoutovae TaxID=1649127 RepID=A0A9P7M1H1_9HYPO|nr:hypothetical protein E4U60_007959 [Claviceps pazoutovae]
MQHVSGSNFVNPAIYFMAILGITPEHGTLREAQDYSYMLAELVYCVRVISLELLLPSKNGDLQGIPEIQNFFVERKKYLQDGSMGVLPCMISLLAYGKNIAMDYGNVGSVFWAEGNRVMVLHGARIVMDNFRAMFRKLLLFCVHVTGGQPARGTEVLSLRFKNGCVRPRNFFLLDGYVMTVTYYNKTDAEWDRPKIIPRFQPWRVGQLLSSYLVYDQPLAALIGDELGDGSFESEYIWANKSEPWHTPKLTSILKQRTGQDLGQELGTLQFRHATVGIGRRFVENCFAKDYYKDETGDVEEPEVATEDPLELSAGRGSALGARRYAVRSELVKHLTQDNIDTFRPLSQSWHVFSD